MQQDGRATSLLRQLGSSESLALAGVVVGHLAAVVPLAANLNLWIDEVYTLETTGGGIIHAVDRSLHFELQPPLYYVLLSFWRTLDDSAFFARCFSILSTALATVASGGLARRYLPGVPPALIAAMVAFNPLTIFAAVEARYYALALLLSSLLLRFFYDGYATAKPSAVARRCYVIVAISALYTYYFLGFFLAAGVVALLLIHRRESARRYLLDMALTAILFLPFAVFLWGQMQTIAATGIADPRTAIEGVRLIWQTAWKQLFPIDQDNSLSVVRAWISRMALPALILVALARRRLPKAATLIPVAWAFTVSVFFVAIAVRLGTDFIGPQHTMVLYLPIVLAALALFQYAGGNRLVFAAAVVSLVFSAIEVVQSYSPMAKLGDWIRVSRYVEQHEVPAEPILMFKAEFTLALAYYYSGRNSLIPLPQPTGRQRYDLTEEVIRGTDEIVGALFEHLGPTRRFWLITSQTQPFRGVNFHPEIVEQFVAQHCRVLLDESFVGSRVRLLELNSEIESMKARTTVGMRS